MAKDKNEKSSLSIITEGNVRGIIKGQNKPQSGTNVKPTAPPPPPQPKNDKKN